MLRLNLFLLLLFVSLNVFPSSSVNEIKTRIEALAKGERIYVKGSVIYAQQAIDRLYRQRDFQLLWWQGDRVSPQAKALLESLKLAYQDGLNPDDYHTFAIENLLAQETALTVNQQVDLELLLSDAFLMFASHSLSGKLNPVTVDAEWFAERRGADFVAILERAMEQQSVAHSLRALLPQQEGYARLKSALVYQLSLAKPEPEIAIEVKGILRQGMTHESIPLIKNRLIDLGFLNKGTLDSPIFDKALYNAVIQFQTQYGLAADGLIGPSTLSLITMSSDKIVQLLQVNMERWRWLPQNLGKTYVIVNIANFSLDVVKNYETQFSMRVIVGRSYRRTPVFSDQIRYLVVNPRWDVPHIIATKDILPQVRKDISYINRMNFSIFQGWGSNAQLIDPAEVNWELLSEKKFPYRLQQAPGPLNALGQIKFMFPNPHSVYLHDTPKRELFKESLRTFSSGCIRVEQPILLADFLLEHSGTGTKGLLQPMIDSGIEQQLKLKQTIPIHILYWTAWVDDQGQLHIRHDVYDRDTRVAQALQAPPKTGD